LRDEEYVRRIDRAISESEQEIATGGELIPAHEAFEMLDSKYYGTGAILPFL